MLEKSASFCESFFAISLSLSCRGGFQGIRFRIKKVLVFPGLDFGGTQAGGDEWESGRNKLLHERVAGGGEWERGAIIA